MLPGAGNEQPPGAEPGHPVGLGQAVEGQADQVGGEGGGAVVDRVVVEDLVVDLVGEYQQVVAAGQVEDAVQQVPGVDGPGGVVRVDDHDSAGPAGDFR